MTVDCAAVQQELHHSAGKFVVCLLDLTLSSREFRYHCFHVREFIVIILVNPQPPRTFFEDDHEDLAATKIHLFP